MIDRVGSGTRRQAGDHSQPNLRLVNTVAVLLAVIWIGLITYTITPLNDDFSYHWRASSSLLQSGDPYDVGQAETQPVLNPYLYPPLFPFLVQPFAFLSLHQAQWAWYGINVMALGGLIWLCISVSTSRLIRRFWGVVVLGSLLAPPVRVSLQLGQVSIILALLMIGSYALAYRRADAAGLCLAAASLIKLFPALLAVHFLLNRPRRVLWWSIVTGIVLLLLPLPIYGLTPYEAFLHSLFVTSKYPYAAEFNISLLGFAERLFTDNLYAIRLAHLPAVAQGIAVISSLVVLGLCLWAGRGETDGFGRLLQFNVWLVGMMLLAPSNGYYNLVFLLLPLFALVGYYERFGEQNVRRWLMVGTALVCIPTGWSNWNLDLFVMTHTSWGILILTPPIYGLAIYLVLLAVASRRYQVLHGSDNLRPIAPNEGSSELTP